MNIPFDPDQPFTHHRECKLSHKVARHAAAEIAQEADARIKELGEDRTYLVDMCKDYYREIVEKNERIEELEYEIEELKEKNRE